MMLTWIQSYLAVVSEGSINLAAARLRLAQPALSRQMRALEHEVGVTLLERGVRGVRPTEAGAAFALEAARVAEGCERAVAAARAAARGEHAPLRIGYLQSAARTLLTPALAELRKRHRGLRVELTDLSPGEQVRALRAGRIDVAIAGQEGAVLGRAFYARTLARLGVVAALPTDHPLADRDGLDLRDLRGDRFVAFPEEDMPGRNRWVAALARKAGFRPRRGPEARDVGHLFALVAAEGVVALLPSYFTCEPHPGARLVPVTRPAARWDLLAIWRRDHAAPVHTLLDALGAQASDRACHPENS